jgi:hypothetical protein
MTRKAREIRKYQASYGMTKQQAEAYYSFKQQSRKTAPVKAKLYYSKTLDRLVTVPDSEK